MKNWQIINWINRINWIKWINLLFVFLLLSFFSACSKSSSGKAISPLAAGSVVVVLGDSISAGYGVGVEKSWVSLLAQKTNWQIINAGISGDTTAGGKDRLEALLLTHQPVLLIIELGGNDILRRINRETIIENINQMITLAKNNNVDVALMAVPELSIFSAALSNLSDAPFYKDIAKQHKITLIPDAISAVLSKSQWRADQIHPNEEGHRQLAEKTAVILQKNNWY